jgi:hypothetical protein
MINHVHLWNVRRETLIDDIALIEREQCQYRFVNFRTVVNAATCQHHRYLRHVFVLIRPRAAAVFDSLLQSAQLPIL